jgi:Fe-S-cluster containining protein
VTLPTPNAESHEASDWRELMRSAAEPQIDAALRDLYTRLDAAVAARGPTCWQSGKCCRFDSYGHRLYVTALEIAWFVRHAPPIPEPTSNSLQLLPRQDECPYQVDGLCSTHTIRPLGCRIFFCQQGTENWQHELYGQFLDDLRRLHETHNLPYRYLEWRAGLAEVMRLA